MIIVSSGTGTVTNINTTAPLSGGPITTSGTITTTMATNKIIGRSTAGSGVMEEITVGTGLSLSGGTLSSTGGATAAGSTNEIQFNNGGAFGANSNLKWNIPNNRAIIGTEAVADTNSRLVVIGKGQMTNTTFAVHNSTGINNALVVRDDGNVGIGTATPLSQLHISNISTTTTRPILTLGGGGASQGGLLEFLASSTLITRIYGRVTGSNEFRIENLGAAYEFRAIGGSAGVGFTVSGTSINGGISLSPNGTYSITGDRLSIRNTTNTQNLVCRNTGQIGVNDLTDGSVITVATSALLDLQSTTKGVLLPRLTTTEINNIATPATGLTVYNTTINTLCFYNGSSWQKCSHANL